MVQKVHLNEEPTDKLLVANLTAKYKGRVSFRIRLWNMCKRKPWLPLKVVYCHYMYSGKSVIRIYWLHLFNYYRTLLIVINWDCWQDHFNWASARVSVTRLMIKRNNSKNIWIMRFWKTRRNCCIGYGHGFLAHRHCSRRPRMYQGKPTCRT